jgi:hypothetical protein
VRRGIGLILGALLLSACQGQSLQTTPALPPPALVEVDSRIELISVVQLLSGYFLVSGLDLAYKREAQAYFAPFKSHPAVQKFKEMSKGDFSFSRVPDSLMRFTRPPALEARGVIPKTIEDSAKDQAELAAFIPLLRDFVQTSNFSRFYDQHQPLYAELSQAALPSVSKVLSNLERYTGSKIHDAKVVLGPLLHDGGFAASYETPGGESEAFAFIGPTSTVNGLPSFGDQARMDDLVGHEFAHVIINPITEKNRAEVDRYEYQFAAIAPAMKKRGYGGKWDVVVSEHVIRAITARLALQNRGQEAQQKVIDQELKWGFAFVPALTERLEYYERNRARYPTISDFYPELLKAFAQPSLSFPGGS